MKTNPGLFFEDYRVGQVIDHAVPRTVGTGERARSITRFIRRATRSIRLIVLRNPVAWREARWMISSPFMWFLAKPCQISL